MKMRSQYIPEEARSTIMNFFRIPLNIFVCVVLYNVCHIILSDFNVFLLIFLRTLSLHLFFIQFFLFPLLPGYGGGMLGNCFLLQLPSLESSWWIVITYWIKSWSPLLFLTLVFVFLLRLTLFPSRSCLACAQSSFSWLVYYRGDSWLFLKNPVSYDVLDTWLHFNFT